MIDLEPFDKDSRHVNAIIDTPKGSRNKYKYDEKIGMFKLGGALPLGAVFPFDFGYIPSTKAGDGDPLDILVLMDEPAFVGCLVSRKANRSNRGQSDRKARDDSKRSTRCSGGRFPQSFRYPLSGRFE